MKPTFAVELNNKASKNGLYGILLRVTFNRKLKRKALKLQVHKNYFNKSAKYGRWIRTSDSEHTLKNNFIRSELEKFEKEILKGLSVDKGLEPKTALETIFRGQKLGFIEYARKRIKDNEKTRKISYKRQMEAAFNKLELYLDNQDIPFEGLTVAFLRDYENYLKKIGNSINTITGNLKKIRTIVFDAIVDGHFPQEKNPFFSFKLKSAPTIKERLIIDEVTAIENCKIDHGSELWHVKNYFLFSLYCAGIRAGDMVCLKWQNIQNNRLVYQMSKNQKYTSIILVPQAIKILNHYRKNTSRDNDFIFPIIADSEILKDPVKRFNNFNSKLTLINRELKTLAMKAGIKKRLSFHVARHSFADIARQSGATVFDISKALNHANLRVTESYLAAFDTQATDKMITGLFGRKGGKND